MHLAVEKGIIFEEFNEEQKDCIQQALDYIEMISPKGGERFKEIKVSIIDGFDILTEGTVDYVCVCDDLIVACDWKFGRGAVKVEDNNQVKAYSAGLMRKYKKPVEFYIAQPRLHYFKSTRFELQELPSLVSEIKTIIENCKSDTMVLSPSEDACRFCKGKSKCPAVNSCMDNNELATITHTGELSNEQIFEYMKKVPLLEDVIKRLKYRAKQALIEGYQHDRWGLQTRRGAANITDAQKAYETVKDFVSMEDFMNCISVKLTSLVDVYARNRKDVDGVTLKQSKSEIMELLAPFVQRKSDSVSLVQK